MQVAKSNRQQLAKGSSAKRPQVCQKLNVVSTRSTALLTVLSHVGASCKVYTNVIEGYSPTQSSRETGMLMLRFGPACSCSDQICSRCYGTVLWLAKGGCLQGPPKAAKSGKQTIQLGSAESTGLASTQSQVTNSFETQCLYV